MHRQMIGHLADNHVRQYRRARRALRDRLRRLRRRLDRAGASVLLADVFDHQQLRGDVFVALAGLFADAAQVLLAGGAVFFFLRQIVLDAFAFQMRGQGPPSARAAVLSSARRRRRSRRKIVVGLFLISLAQAAMPSSCANNRN